ncbi:MAG: L-seryl-tRNA(Sec) selenium transferase, partial [Gemmatimonadaceae bacterium]
AVRAVIDDVRRGVATPPPASDADWAGAVAAALAKAQRPSLRRVINGTGVVLHTNLGRAPLAAAARDAAARVAAGYANLEYDIDRGARGSRYTHCVALLRELTGAEEALVVNNNAAALVLVLNTLAMARGVVISRGELVEIGGSFRIPDIMERSGARLVEVGTTNRTHAQDYERALTDDVGAVVKVHRSNFAMQGFVSDVDARTLAGIVALRRIPLVHDLGSGLLIPLDDIGLSGEPTAADAVRAGASVITMSGDKLLGGPQAGIIVGSAELVRGIRENPLTRALRVDKITLAALEATLALYRDPALALREVPVLAMLGRTVADLRARATAIRDRLQSTDGVDICDSAASVGGGTFPNTTIPSVALAFAGDAAQLEQRLRLGDPAVIGRIAGDRLLVDLRAIQPDEDIALAGALRTAFVS